MSAILSPFTVKRRKQRRNGRKGEKRKKGLLVMSTVEVNSQLNVLSESKRTLCCCLLMAESLRRGETQIKLRERERQCRFTDTNTRESLTHSALLTSCTNRRACVDQTQFMSTTSVSSAVTLLVLACRGSNSRGVHGLGVS